MFRIIQGTLIVAALGMAFAAGYEMKPSRLVQKPVTPVGELTPASEPAESSPAVDIRVPVREMTPIADIPVDRKDIAFKWIEKELGITTTVLDPRDKQTLSVLQPLDESATAPVPAARP